MSDHGVSVRCPHNVSQFQCSRFDGLASKAPKRQRCSYCGGQLVRTPTVWGAVEWRKDNRYTRPEVTYPSPDMAQDACSGEQVVRPFVVTS